MQYLVRAGLLALAAAALSGCTVITVAGTAAGLAVTAGSLAVDAAVGTAHTSFDSELSPAGPTAVTAANRAVPFDSPVSVVPGALTVVLVLAVVTGDVADE